MNTSIAVIGAACRLPGGIRAPHELWRLLEDGRDAVTEVGPDRWNLDRYYHPGAGVPGRSYTWAAGVLPDIDMFDPELFGIAPREVVQIDPQHRLLLELSWEALEDAGVRPSRLAGGDTGVFVGISSTDYASLRYDDPASGDAYFMSGNTLSVAANRLSYTLDLHGPSMAVDTACSSSLVAVHQACRSLETGEAPTALVGGVNLLLSPFPFIGFSAARMLSPSGRCRAFDAAGDGYVRAEGGVVLLLKPLQAARDDGDTVRAIIRASAVSCDGRTTGLSFPSTAAQSDLLQRVYDDSGISGDELAYVEAHGTGTVAGDIAEAAALGRTLGHRRKRPLPIGSVKTNLGHLEPASGVAGLLKAVLVLQNGTIPQTLHFREARPEIDLEHLNLRVVVEPTRLGEEIRPWTIGVSSFGFGGANAHVILREAEAVSPAGRSFDPRPPILVLSAATETALKARARQLADGLGQDDTPDIADLVSTAAHHRDHLPSRAAVIATGQADLSERLHRLADGDDTPGVVHHRAVGDPAEVALLFSGNGSQWAGMGRRLLIEDPTFRRRVNSVDEVLRSLGGDCVTEELSAEPQSSRLDETEIAQPALFALQLGVVERLEQRGLSFQSVAGHSVGEVAAAVAAGALSLEQGVRVIHHRSVTQGTTRGRGTMAAVGLGRDDLLRIVERDYPAIQLAGVNSHCSVTIAGPVEVLQALGRRLERERVFFRLLELDYAFHSTAMDPIREPLLTALDGLEPSEGRRRFVSAVTGSRLGGTELRPDYWWRNIRQPVRFADALYTLIEEGARVFVEVGPHPILRGYVRHALAHEEVEGVHVMTLARDRADRSAIDLAVATVHTAGGDVDLDRLAPNTGRRAPLPPYPWQRKRFWFTETEEASPTVRGRPDHELLGTRRRRDEPEWESQIDLARVPYLADHVVDGRVLFPATGFLRMALAAAESCHEDGRVELTELEIRRPMVLGDDRSRTVRTRLDPQTGRFAIVSRERLAATEWTEHVVGRAPTPAWALHPPTVSIDAVHRRLTEHSTGEQLRKACGDRGLEYGPSFQSVATLHVGAGEALAELRRPNGTMSDAVHPAVVDGALQTVLALGLHDAAGTSTDCYVPVRFGRVRLFDDAKPAWAYVRLEYRGPRSVVASIDLLATSGRVMARLERCRFQRIARSSPTSGVPLVLRERIVPRSRPEPRAPAPLPPLPKLVDADGAGAHGAGGDGSLLLDAAALAFAYQAVSDAMEDGDELDSTDLPGSVGLVHRILDVLVANQLAYRKDGGWRLEPEPGLPAAPTILRSLLAEHPRWVSEAVLVGRAGLALPGLLSGDFEPAEMELGDTGEHLLTDSPTFSPVNESVSGLVEHVVSHWPPNRELRILDVDAGPGLEAALARCTTDDRITAATTSVKDSPTMGADLDRDAPRHVRYASLDELFEQAMTASFDLAVVGVGVHRFGSPDVASRVRRLLVEDGLLLMVAYPPTAAWELVASARGLPRPHSVDELRQALEAIGLSDLTAACVGPHGAPVILGRNREPAPLPESKPRRWALLPTSGATSVCRAVAERLRASGHRAITIDEVGERRDDRAASADEVVLVDRLDPILEPTGRDALEQSLEACARTVDLVRWLTERGGEPQPRLWVVTVSAGGAPVVTPAVQGLARVVANEAPQLRTRRVTVRDASDVVAVADTLVPELLRPDREDEVVLTPEARLVPRLEEHSFDRPTGASITKCDAVRLQASSAPALAGLRWTGCTRITPGPGQIQIAVRAAGLNFRDVMWTMGLLPDEAVENGFAGAGLGMELAGEVTAVGAGVDHPSVGDGVLGFASRALASHVTTDARAVVPIPRGMGFAAAATLPTVFLTAYYALKHLAGLRAGERLLVHGAAGGVGLAALQYARYVGAEVFGTAGTPAKRDVLRLLGVDHVHHSRDLTFADEIRLATDGEGVDVVLNSLGGEALERSLGLLRPFGRFIELGKRDIYADSTIGLYALRENVTFHAVDVDQILKPYSDLGERMLRDIMDLFEAGVFRPLPHRVIPAHRAQEAFRLLQRSRHIGKLVVQTDPAPEPSVPRPATGSGWRADPNGTYLITGGFEGLGLATAQWLADRGAQHLVLVGRRGESTPGAAEAVADLRARGIDVIPEAADVADETQLRHVLAPLKEGGAPLRGVVHAAMVAHDATIANMTRETLRRALTPKIAGAWNLHRLTERYELHLFLLYSSVTTDLGAPGSGAYVAANRALEALARHRKASGLPGLAMAWGAVSDVGMLARDPRLRRSVQSRFGDRMLDWSTAAGFLGNVLDRGEAKATVAMVDWGRINRRHPSASAPRFSWLRSRATGLERTSDDRDLAALIDELGTERAIDAVVQRLREEAGSVLGIPAEKLDPDTELVELGLDSLMSMELIVAVEENLGAALDTTAVASDRTLSGLARRIVQQAQGEGRPANTSQYELELAEVAARHGEEPTQVSTHLEREDDIPETQQLINK